MSDLDQFLSPTALGITPAPDETMENFAERAVHAVAGGAPLLEAVEFRVRVLAGQEWITANRGAYGPRTAEAIARTVERMLPPVDLDLQAALNRFQMPADPDPVLLAGAGSTVGHSMADYMASAIEQMEATNPDPPSGVPLFHTSRGSDIRAPENAEERDGFLRTYRQIQRRYRVPDGTRLIAPGEVVLPPGKFAAEFAATHPHYIVHTIPADSTRGADMPDENTMATYAALKSEPRGLSPAEQVEQALGAAHAAAVGLGRALATRDAVPERAEECEEALEFGQKQGTRAMWGSINRSVGMPVHQMHDVARILVARFANVRPGVEMLTVGEAAAAIVELEASLQWLIELFNALNPDQPESESDRPGIASHIERALGVDRAEPPSPDDTTTLHGLLAHLRHNVRGVEREADKSEPES